MEQSHTAVRAKIPKSLSATNVVSRFTLSTSALPMMPSAIPVGKKGHYQRACLAGKAVHGIEKEEESFFLGSVTLMMMAVEIDIMDKNITFKLDTGAYVSQFLTAFFSP